MTDAYIHRGLERVYGEPGDLCLCLSGGGFRAAAYHLGVTRWLFERGVLQQVSEIRSVSGGSILAGWLAANRPTVTLDPSPAGVEDFERVISRPFRTFLQQDIRTQPILRTIGVNALNRNRRVDLLTDRVRRLVGSSVAAGAGPRFVVVAFDVERRSQVDIELTPGRDIARAVVASAAFPPWFGPVELDGRRYLDGGLACNYGVAGDTVHSWRALFVSDASRSASARLARRGLPLSLLAVGLQRDGANRAFRNQLASADSDAVVVAVAPLAAATWFGPSDETGLSRVPEWIARARTDLAGFSPNLLQQVERAGWESARDYLGESLTAWAVRVSAGERRLQPSRPSLLQLLTAWAEERD